MKIQFSIFLLHLLCTLWLNAEPLVQVFQGILNGTFQRSRNGRIYSEFLGIPYGESPTGNLRFKNPLPARKWNGIRQADTFGNVCPQISDGEIIGNEDCLFLNVFTPRLAFSFSMGEEKMKKALLPVMVYIHPGAYHMGSSHFFRAEYLLDKDIILVTINFRLSILGFLSTGDSAAPGNFGMKDQVLALKWVKTNIRAFQGNPNQVTLFGNSVGGASVGLHALSRASDGLFHKYIIQSGSPLADWAYRSRNKLIEYSRKVAPVVGCDFNTTSEIFVDCLRTRSIDSLLNSRSIFGEIVEFSEVWWTPTDEPEVDGAFLTDSPINLINQNQMKDLPLMTGGVSEEGLYYSNKLYANSSLYTFAISKLDQIIRLFAGDLIASKNEEKFTASAKKFYFGRPVDTSDKDKFIGNFRNYISDSYFLYPEVSMLEKIAPKFKSSIFFYSFAYRGRLNNQSAVENNRTLGVGHLYECPHLFPYTPPFFGVPSLNFTATEISVSELMVDLWTSFAETGKPVSEKLESREFWVPYNPQTTTHLQIGNIHNDTDPTVTLSQAYYTKRMNFWKKNAPI